MIQYEHFFPNVQGSVHRKYIPFNIFPRCKITQFIYLFLENCSTCFGWYLHPSSGAHKLYLHYLVPVKPLLLPAAIGGR